VTERSQPSESTAADMGEASHERETNANDGIHHITLITDLVILQIIVQWVNNYIFPYIVNPADLHVKRSNKK
jgi:hypothetical protein